VHHSGAAPQQGVVVPVATLDILFNLFLFILIDLNCASWAAPQQRVASPGGALDFYFIFILICLFNLFELYIRCCSTSRSCGTRKGTRLLSICLSFYLLCIIIIKTVWSVWCRDSLVWSST
jgi:hypothetical protein